MPNPTPQQRAIIDAARDTTANLFISAFAGTGKTSAIEMAVHAMVKVNPAATGVALTFNVKNKDDLEKRLPPQFSAKTLNGIGHVAWGRAIGKRLVVENNKLGKIITQVLKNYDLTGEDSWANVRQIVRTAMNSGLVPKEWPHTSLIPDSMDSWCAIAEAHWITPDEALLAAARAVLVESIKQSFGAFISYDDQIYMSAMFNGQFPRYQNVLVDEYQDLSPLNHIQLARSAAGRLIVAGDDLQGIYSFRGADADSGAKLRKLRKEWIDLPLTVSFRCPKAIVMRQTAHAHGFTAAEANPPGTILATHPRDQFEAQFGDEETKVWHWSDVQDLNLSPVAILCRNNAPLLGMAMRLIKQHIGCTILGRDIGKGLITLSRKLIPDDDAPQAECGQIISEWKDSQVQLALANKQEEKVGSIVDRAECLLAVLESARSAYHLRSLLETIFSQESTKVILSTIHKFKGMEAPLVIHLDHWRVPSRYAKAALADGHSKPMEQEKNLKYVCETRVMDTLVLASLQDFV